MADSRLCSIDGCGKPHDAGGYCRPHYYRLKRYGDPLRGIAPHGKPMNFIRDIAIAYQGDDCLTWPFGKTERGYGSIWLDGQMRSVSRYICELVNGPPPTPKHQAAHSCGKGHLSCCTPRHLRWATRIENQADKVRHGTSLVCLSDEDVHAIRALRGIKPLREVAAIYGAHLATIWKIQKGKARRSVT
jgi:hypothetical protein